MRWLLMLLLAAPWAARADTIYLCKAYSGGMFWSSVPCGQKQATVDRMVSVPAEIPWEQKVALGEAARAQGQAAATPQFVQPLPLAQITRQNECAQLLSAIADLEQQKKNRRSWLTPEQQKSEMERLEDRRKRLQC